MVLTSRPPGFEAYGQPVGTSSCLAKPRGSPCLMSITLGREGGPGASLDGAASSAPTSVVALTLSAGDRGLRVQGHTDPPGIFLVGGGAGNSLHLTHSSERTACGAGRCFSLVLVSMSVFPGETCSVSG